MKRVYTLYRVSTKQQVDREKNDIPMQRLECHKFVDSHDDWRIVKEFEEKGISGYKVSAEERDAIQELKRCAEKGEFDVLLIFMFDRLGRIPDETPFVLKWFVQHGIEVWSTQEGQQVFENDIDDLNNYLRFWVAGTESRKIGTRIRTRIAQMEEEGEYIGGRVPFGYMLSATGRKNKKGRPIHKLEVNLVEAAFVQELFDKAYYEGFGAYRLEQYARERGIQRENGEALNAGAIKRMFRNRIYIGYSSSKAPYNASLQIVKNEVFDGLQKILDIRARPEGKNKGTTKALGLLCGNIFCGHCRRPMAVNQCHDTYTKKMDKSLQKTCCGMSATIDTERNISQKSAKDRPLTRQTALTSVWNKRSCSCFLKSRRYRMQS